jgi:hypothetical protein
MAGPIEVPAAAEPIDRFQAMPGGFLFAVRWRQWIGGIVFHDLPLANNTITRRLVMRGVPAGQRQREFLVVGVHRSDMKYNRLLRQITLARLPRVKGWGYDTLDEALDKIRSVVQDDGGADIGEMKGTGRLRSVLGALLRAENAGGMVEVIQ